MLSFFGYLFITIGIVVFLISAIGLIRMPDVYNRMQVGTKSTTMGTVLVLLGVSFLEPSWSLKLLLLAVFILMTNPISASVIARATHTDEKLEIDELKEAGL